MDELQGHQFLNPLAPSSMYPLEEGKFKDFITEAYSGIFKDENDIKQWAKDIEKGVNVAFIETKLEAAKTGSDNLTTIFISLSFQPKKDWGKSKGGSPLEGARDYANIRVDMTGIMDMYQTNTSWDFKLKKAKVKSAKDVIKKLNNWIKKPHK